jgi:hypothetical protein
MAHPERGGARRMLDACGAAEKYDQSRQELVLGAPLGATFLGSLASRIGRRPGSLDVVLVAPRADGDPPVELLAVATPDHVTSLRAALAAGFNPVGAEVLMLDRAPERR